MKTKNELNYNDDEMMEWAEENAPDMISVKKKINKSNIYNNVEVVNDVVIYKATGEIIQCVKVVDGETNFKVEV